MGTTLRALASCTLLALAARSEAQYAPVGVDLGTLGGSSTLARAVNTRGQVVGFSYLPDGEAHAFSWTQAGGMVDLGDLGGRYSVAQLVDESGRVFGVSDTADGSPHLFSWTASSGIVDQGPPPADDFFGYDNIELTDVNRSGQVVGYAEWSGGLANAFLWTKETGAVDLGSLGGSGRRTYAQSINDAGEVVGSSSYSSCSRAFRWTPAAGMMNLGTLAGCDSGALAINDSGQVVGSYYLQHPDTGAAIPRSFFWTQGTGMTDLEGPAFSTDATYAYAMNESGRIVGTTTRFGDGYGAFLWTKDQGMVSLGVNSSASAISNRGQVVGETWSGGPQHVFLWTQKDGMIDLGAFGGDRAQALAVNDSGEVVGHYGLWPTRAVMWKTDPISELTLLLEDVSGMSLPPGLITSLSAKLRDALSGLAGSNGATACDALASLIAQASAQDTKKLTHEQAVNLQQRGADLRAMLRCP